MELVTDKHIEDSAELWETGALGQNETFARIAEDIQAEALDKAAGLQMVSIRLQRSLLEDLKMIAHLNGQGYQPLVKQVLKRFVDCEKKRLLKEAASQDGPRAAIA